MSSPQARWRRPWRGGVGVGALLVLGCASAAQAIGPKSSLRLAELRLDGEQGVTHVSALERLAWEVKQRTSVEVAPQATVLQASDAALFAHPLVYLTGERAFAPPDEAVLKRWRRFVTFGGLLWIDGAEARAGQGFDRSVRQLLGALLPESALVRLSREHAIYKSFYLLDRAVGRLALVPDLEGVERDGRLLVVYSQNDLGGAWSRDAFGQWERNVYPGGERQRELAIRWGINIVIYALCLDYKADQVHIPFVLKRRRWRPSASDAAGSEPLPSALPLPLSPAPAPGSSPGGGRGAARR
ncbi:MAG: DUF4159 domain-containing protein [Proteobacteria bacterium]|nr:DUF4159 domain-containing protein [Pseudomonadota bacterium]